MNYISCNMDKFINDTKDKQILCFGGGGYFQVMCCDMTDRYPNMKLAGVLDNDISKCGKTIAAAKYKARIYSLENALSEFDFNNTAIVITTAQLNAVKEQLEDIKEFDNTDVYSFFEIKKNSAVPLEELIRSSDKPLIPKVIHYCWFGGSPIPERLQKCIDSWKVNCHDYEIIRWDESNIDFNRYDFLKQAYVSKKWAFISDYIRFEVVYNEGGIYFDTDVELIKSPEILRYNKGFIGVEITGGINSGSGFGSVKHHKTIKELKENYENGKWDLFSPNIGKETTFFYDKEYKINGKIQTVYDMTILPFNILLISNMETGRFNIDCGTVAIHHYDGCWRDDLNKYRRV